MQQFAGFHFGAAAAALAVRLMYGLEQNWIGDAGSNAQGSPVTSFSCNPHGFVPQFSPRLQRLQTLNARSQKLCRAAGAYRRCYSGATTTRMCRQAARARHGLLQCCAVRDSWYVPGAAAV